MAISEWNVSLATGGSGRPPAFLNYDSTLRGPDSSLNGQPALYIGGGSPVILELNDTLPRGFNHGAFLIGCLFKAGSVFDTRCMIQDATNGGFYFARFYQVSGGRVVGSLHSTQPYPNSLTSAGQKSGVFELFSRTDLLTGLDENDPFYVYFEWEATPEPVDSESRPYVKLIIKAGTSSTSLEQKCLACVDFDLADEAAEGVRPNNYSVLSDPSRLQDLIRERARLGLPVNAAWLQSLVDIDHYGERWSISTFGSYCLGPSLYEHTIFGSDVLGSLPFASSEQVRLIYYELLKPGADISFSWAETWDRELDAEEVYYEDWDRAFLNGFEIRAVTNYRVW